MKTRGIYFLANDHVFDLTVAFLNSFRRHNPTMPLCLIPFRNDIDRLKSLSTEYNFDIYDDLDYLSECDAISTQLHGSARGQYRKLAIWDGKFDEFVYIDVDTVVLKSLDFIFEFIPDFDFTVSMSNVPVLLHWVWQDVANLSGKLEEDQINYAANTGFIASRRGTITRDEVRSKIGAAQELKPYMNLDCYEQPFLNYLIVTSGKRYTSIIELKRLLHRHDIPEEVWGGIKWPGVMVHDGYVYLNDNPAPANFFLVHWNGVWRRHDIEPTTASSGVDEGTDTSNPTQDDNMPYRDLWQYYREFRDFRFEGNFQQ